MSKITGKVEEIKVEGDRYSLKINGQFFSFFTKAYQSEENSVPMSQFFHLNVSVGKEYTFTYSESKKLNNKGNPYKNITNIEPATGENSGWSQPQNQDLTKYIGALKAKIMEQDKKIEEHESRIAALEANADLNALQAEEIQL